MIGMKLVLCYDVVSGFVVATRWLRVVMVVGILFVVFFVWLENLSLHMGGFMVEKERG